MPLTSLDAFFSDKPFPPTFIKLDIEAAELPALTGARGILRRHRPKLAIAAYHKNDDIYAIPKYVKSANPDYRFALRHYTPYYTETVIYAV